MSKSQPNDHGKTHKPEPKPGELITRTDSKTTRKVNGATLGGLGGGGLAGVLVSAAARLLGWDLAPEIEAALVTLLAAGGARLIGWWTRDRA